MPPRRIGLSREHVNSFKVAIAGLGRIGGVHLDAWRRVPGVEVVAVCDDDSDAQKRAASASLPCYATLPEMLRGGSIDAVSLCTPPAMHLPMAARAMEQGVHVLCEKPLAVNPAAAERLTRISRTTGAKLQMATKFRHVPEINQARQMIREGGIGEVVSAAIEFAGAVDMTQRWNSSLRIAGGGVIMDNGSHALDLLQFLFGPIERVHAARLHPLQKLEVEDQAIVLAETASGVVGEVTLTWSMQPASDTYLTVRGSKGSIAIGWKSSFVRKNGEPPVQIANGYDKNVAHERMMSAFRDMAQGRGMGWITLQECVAVQQAVECAYRSMRSGAWSSLDDRQALAA
ncbi:MAG: Gfo/Idh/MocA family oxidoreductase [Bryobacteraceae bacterium]